MDNSIEDVDLLAEVPTDEAGNPIIDPEILDRLKERERVAQQKIEEAEIVSAEAKSALAAWQEDLRKITKELREIGGFPIASQLERR